MVILSFKRLISAGPITGRMKWLILTRQQLVLHKLRMTWLAIDCE